MRPLRLASLLAATLAASALAQTGAIGTTDPSRGPTLLPGSTAFADEATALVYNPAGLTHTGALNGVFIHERSNSRGLDADGLYLASALTGVTGLGVGLEWLRPTSGATQRAKTSLGLALGPKALSLGLGLHWFFGAPTWGMVSADLGLQSQPVRWLSFGALVRNVGAPVLQPQGTELAREYTLGLGLRPIGERVSIGVDWITPERDALNRSRLQYTVAAHPLKGLRLLAGVSHGFNGSAPLALQAGVGVDLDHLGYTQGFGFTGETVDFQYVARFSAEKYPSIVPKRKIAVVELEGLGDGGGGGTIGTLLGIAAEDQFLRALRFFERAATDPELAAVVLKIEGAGVGFARADELRSAVLRLRASGKKVYAWLLSVGDPEYLIASACDGLYGAPESMFLVDGLRSSVTFLGGAAEKLDVTIDVARVGAFKNAPDQLTRTSMSAEQKEALNAYLDTAQRTVERRVLEQRPKLTAETWRSSIDEGLKSMKRAKELGQLDDILDPQAFEELLKKELPGAAVDKSYRPFDARTGRWGSKREIAIVPVLGTITGGKSSQSPMGTVAGAQSFIEAITAAAEDDDVAAIVVRVDSGGGDGLASYLMYRAVLEAKKKKPVVVSMGDAAASGGYYVSAGADEIWASPTTLTGSIGVFFMKPALKGLAERYGITEETLTRGAHTGVDDYFEPWSDEQRAIAQRWVDDFYDTFITEVASARRLDKAAVDLVARGRVWSGEDAKARGLVDNLGGLMDAVKAARRRALVPDDEELELTIRQPRGGLVGTLLSASAPTLLETRLPEPATPALLEPLLKALGPDAWLLTRPGVQARLEYSLRLR